MTATTIPRRHVSRIDGGDWNALVNRRPARLSLGANPGDRETVLEIRNDALDDANDPLDLERFAIVKLGDPVVTPTNNEVAFKDSLALVGETPDSAAVPFAVLQEPAKRNTRARAMIAGVTQVRVKGTGPYADCTVNGSTDYLECGSSGPARVLWSESGSGERWGLVHLGGGQRSQRLGTSAFWTVAEYDPVTGDIIQTFDRGLGRNREYSADVGLLFSSDGYLYAAGTARLGVNIGDAYLFKYDIDSGEVVWQSSAGVLNTAYPRNVTTQHVDGMLCEADDGAIWLCRGGNPGTSAWYVARFDPATGGQTHAYGSAASLGSQIFPAASGAVCVASPGIPDIRRISATGTLTHTAASQNATHIFDDGTYLIVVHNQTIKVLSKADLSTVASATPLTSPEAFATVVADGTTIWTATTAATNKYRAYDYSLVEQWNANRDNTAATSIELQLSGGNVFDMAQAVRKINPTTGAETWQSTTFANGPLRRTGFAIGSDFVVSANGANTVQASGDPTTETAAGLVCLDESTGATRWWDNTNVHAVVVTPDDRIFACHGRRGNQFLSGSAVP